MRKGQQAQSSEEDMTHLELSVLEDFLRNVGHAPEDRLLNTKNASVSKAAP